MRCGFVVDFDFCFDYSASIQEIKVLKNIKGIENTDGHFNGISDIVKYVIDGMLCISFIIMYGLFELYTYSFSPHYIDFSRQI